MPALSGVDLVLSTERQRPEAVADRIRVALPSHPVASAPSRREDQVQIDRPDHRVDPDARRQARWSTGPRSRDDEHRKLGVVNESRRHRAEQRGCDRTAPA